jgi:hypothetical protein
MTVIKFPIAAPPARAAETGPAPVVSAPQKTLLIKALTVAYMLELDLQFQFKAAQRERLAIERRLLRLGRDDKAPGSQR